MEEKKSSLDYEHMKEKALEQLLSGKSLYGKDGAFAPLLQQFLETALEAELDHHLGGEERSKCNRKNGKQSKRVFQKKCLGGHQASGTFPSEAASPISYGPRSSSRCLPKHWR